MNKNAFSACILAAFAFLIPAGARFASGIFLTIEVNLLAVFSIFLSAALEKLNFRREKPVFLLAFAAVFAQGYSVFLQLVAPICAFSMQFSVYLAAFSPLALGIFKESGGISAQKGRPLLPVMLAFDGFAVIFAAIRDVLGFGSIAIIHSGKLAELKIFGESWRGARFFASTPFAALMLSAAAFAAIRASEGAKFFQKGAKK